MKSSKIRLGLYRGLYWANQSMLAAVRALEEVRADSTQEPPPSDLLEDDLRRTRAMIENSRLLMNRVLADWVGQSE
jgi:hypothetical protein